MAAADEHARDLVEDPEQLLRVLEQLVRDHDIDGCLVERESITLDIEHER